jgi:uncharacterized SAM-binding protein YcdF (DUF218 family)
MFGSWSLTDVFQTIWDPIFMALCLTSIPGLKNRTVRVVLLLVGVFGTLVIYSSLTEKLSNYYTSSVHAPIELVSVDAVVVLSGGTTRYNSEQGQFVWGTSADRLIEGVRLYQRVKAKWFVVSGDTDDNQPQRLGENLSMRKWAELAGIESDHIIHEDKSRRTLQHPENLKSLFESHQIKSFYVVTSDYHMPRTQKIFRRFFPEPEMKFYPVLRDFKSGGSAENIDQFQKVSKEFFAFLVQ